MEELRSKVRALLALGDSDMTADLVIDVVARGLGKLGGRPKKPVTNGLETGSEPVTKPVTNGIENRSVAVSPTPPSPSGSSLSLLPDPERAIPGLKPFPVVGGTGEWVAPQSLLESHQAAFPAVDVLAEYRKCHAYVVSTPAKRKTPRGMPTALFRWLSISVDKGTAVKRQADGPRPAGAAAVDATTKYLREQATCSFHREIPDKPSAEYVSWCTTCKRLGPRKQRVTGETQPELLAAVKP